MKNHHRLVSLPSTCTVKLQTRRESHSCSAIAYSQEQYKKDKYRYTFATSNDSEHVYHSNSFSSWI